MEPRKVSIFDFHYYKPNWPSLPYQPLKLLEGLIVPLKPEATLHDFYINSPPAALLRASSSLSRTLCPK